MSKHYSHIIWTPTTDDWLPGYLEIIPGLVEKHGGRYLYRTTDFESVEMPELSTTFVVLIEWPDAAAAAACYADPGYESIKQARIAGSQTQWYNAAAYEGCSTSDPWVRG